MAKTDLRKEPDPHEEEEELELPRDTELCGEVEVQETLAELFDDITKALDAHGCLVVVSSDRDYYGVLKGA